MKRRTPIEKRLMSKVSVNENGCWIYTGAIDTTGYGRIGRGGRGEGSTHTHRAAYELLWGPITDGLHVDHLCRVRACCNPLHLEAVTQAVNNQRSWDARKGKPIRVIDQYTTEDIAS
jgi:hypothetical protein